MTASRKSMHVDEKFEKRMKDLQKKIMMKQGIKPSLRELTAQIPDFAEFDLIENRLVGDIDQFAVRINFDMRKKK